MEIPVTEAKGQLTDLVRRAESGEDIVLTRHGQAVVRLVALAAKPSRAERLRVIAEVQAAVRHKGVGECDAARSQDFLYDEFGLPR